MNEQSEALSFSDSNYWVAPKIALQRMSSRCTPTNQTMESLSLNVLGGNSWVTITFSVALSSLADLKFHFPFTHAERIC